MDLVYVLFFFSAYVPNQLWFRSKYAMYACMYVCTHVCVYMSVCLYEYKPSLKDKWYLSLLSHFLHVQFSFFMHVWIQAFFEGLQCKEGTILSTVWRCCPQWSEEILVNGPKKYSSMIWRNICRIANDVKEWLYTYRYIDTFLLILKTYTCTYMHQPYVQVWTCMLCWHFLFQQISQVSFLMYILMGWRNLCTTNKEQSLVLK